MTIKYRKLYGLKRASDPAWAQLGDPEGLPLSDLLNECRSDRLFLCGSLDQMPREYAEEPTARGWSFARKYVHEYRSPVYQSISGRTVSVKLIGESWLPGCADMLQAIPAWRELQSEWERVTKLPLLTTPTKTGQAFLWESLPKREEFPQLPDDLARHIRAINTQHRIEVLKSGDDMARVLVGETPLFEYDGRWMYASLATLDRLPVGEPIETNQFQAFKPGWYHVRVTVPRGWRHIGLLPMKDSESAWRWPSEPGEQFETWASEPELTVALANGWRIEFVAGWQWESGRPLGNWARKLIEMKQTLDARNPLAGKSVRSILNNTIGALHNNSYQREEFVSDADWPEYRRANADLLEHGATARRGAGVWERVEQDGVKGRMITIVVPDTSPLSIFMPHWSSQVYSLERARVAQWALQCPRAALVKIHGDAVYATEALPLTDNQNLGQPRLKGVKNGEEA